MRYTSRNLTRAAKAVLTGLLFSSALFAQSSDQNFPTPVRTNEISGVIKARDIGDSRLTSHFYTFEGGQGDLFINVQTTNFSGDVDVFVVPGLRPLTKMVMYADAASSETGRVVYLRKPETILLRIEGRTPGDAEATYRVKFAGGFLGSKAPDVTPEVPKVSSETQSSVRVNSVGTIIEIIPKPTPEAKETPFAEVEERAASPERSAELKAPIKTAETKDVQPVAEPAPPRQSVVVTDPLRESAKGKTPPRRNNRARIDRDTRPPVEEKQRDVADADRKTEETAAEPARPTASSRRSARPKAEKMEEPDPMANVRLVIRFKDGSVIERPMTEVSRFSVERATLTVISKDGTTGRYRMAEVAGVSIE